VFGAANPSKREQLPCGGHACATGCTLQVRVAGSLRQFAHPCRARPRPPPPYEVLSAPLCSPVVCCAAGLVAIGATFAALPFVIRERNQNHNLAISQAALTGSQVMRGAFLNTGSKDVGPDPDWDMKTHTYRGGSTRSFAPTAEQVDAHRRGMAARQESAQQAAAPTAGTGGAAASS
jgi:hypothetical protein